MPAVYAPEAPGYLAMQASPHQAERLRQSRHHPALLGDGA